MPYLACGSLQPSTKFDHCLKINARCNPHPYCNPCTRKLHYAPAYMDAHTFDGGTMA